GGDHRRAGWDGFNGACTYGVSGVGEVQLDLSLVTVAAGNATPFAYHFDDAATTYVQGNPDPSSPAVRQLEKTMGGITAVNPHTGLTESILGTGLGSDQQSALVDKVGQRLLHMRSSFDLNREPTFTLFGNPNFFFTGTGNTTPVVGTGFAWNHGDIQPQIARTYIAMVGPGVRNLGITARRTSLPTTSIFGPPSCCCSA